MTEITNMAASVKARLGSKARELGKPVEYMYLHYGIERFLYRLSQSSYADNLILKGGLAFLTFDASFPRPTRDIDFLGFGDRDIATFENIVREICEVPVDRDDGLTFDLDSIQAETIQEQNAYEGIRARFAVYLERSRIRIQIDVGFGDAVYPAPEIQSYPVLLEDQPVPRIRTYPPETILAEKIHTIIRFDTLNSRLKDFYDIWYLSETRDIDGNTICEAIEMTFSRRETPVPAAFRDTFFEEFASLNASRWPAFQRKLQIDEELPVMLDRVQAFAASLLAAVALQQPFDSQWVAGSGWTEI
jgi:predicted nucleotidyltransferase component of viral defense system